MTEDEVRAFMSEGSRTGKLATVRPDSTPHVAAIWFDFADTGDVVFLTHHTSVKAKNMAANPNVSLLVDRETMPFHWARIDGTVSFSEEPEARLYWATETCRRYVGDDLAPAFGRRNGVPGELLVRLSPTALRGQWAVAD